MAAVAPEGAGREDTLTLDSACVLALRECEERWRFALENSGLGVWDWDIVQGRVLYNGPAGGGLGAEPVSLPAMFSFATFREMVHHEDRQGMDEALEAHLRGGAPAYRHEHRLSRPDGGEIWILDRGKVVARDAQGNPLRMVGTHADISQRRQAAQLFNTVFESNTAVKLVVDPQTRTVVNANAAAVEFYGYPREEMVGMPVNRLNTTEPLALASFLKEAMQRSRTYFLFKHRLRSGELRDVEVYAAPIDYMGRTCLFSIIHDVTEKTRFEERLKFLATTDELTQCLNRRAFFEELYAQLGFALRGEHALCVALFDLDFFKLVNDAYGHDVGDLVLRGFAEKLRSGLRGYDRVGRIGGEEFCVILPGADREGATALVERILKRVANKPLRAGSARIGITASCGLACLGPDDDARSLMKRADLALYAAKQDGRNCCRCRD